MRRMMLTMAVAAAALAPGLALAQDGDAAAGQRVFNQCRACHTPDPGGRNGVGPNLWGIVGRRAASIEGFRYSANMRTLGEGGQLFVHAPGTKRRIIFEKVLSILHIQHRVISLSSMVIFR